MIQLRSRFFITPTQKPFLELRMVLCPPHVTISSLLTLWWHGCLGLRHDFFHSIVASFSTRAVCWTHHSKYLQTLFQTFSGFGSLCGTNEDRGLGIQSPVPHGVCLPFVFVSCCCTFATYLSSILCDLQCRMLLIYWLYSIL